MSESEPEKSFRRARDWAIAVIVFAAVSIGGQLISHCQTLQPVKKTAIKHSDFFKPYGKGFAISSAAYWGGVVFDVARTQSCQKARTCTEANPFLRTSQGGANIGRAVGVSAGIYGVTLLLEKKYPKLASIVRLSVGGGHFLAAGRQW